MEPFFTVISPQHNYQTVHWSMRHQTWIQIGKSAHSFIQRVLQHCGPSAESFFDNRIRCSKCFLKRTGPPNIIRISSVSVCIISPCIGVPKTYNPLLHRPPTALQLHAGSGCQLSQFFPYHQEQPAATEALLLQYPFRFSSEFPSSRHTGFPGSCTSHR